MHDNTGDKWDVGQVYNNQKFSGCSILQEGKFKVRGCFEGEFYLKIINFIALFKSKNFLPSTFYPFKISLPTIFVNLPITYDIGKSNFKTSQNDWSKRHASK